jgi:hypothetical protein
MHDGAPPVVADVNGVLRKFDNPEQAGRLDATVEVVDL